MTTPPSNAIPNPPAAPLGAVCPHCKADPVLFSIITAVLDLPGGKLAVASIFCANQECRVLFNVQIVGGDPTLAQPRRGGIVAPV